MTTSSPFNSLSRHLKNMRYLSHCLKAKRKKRCSYLLNFSLFFPSPTSTIMSHWQPSKMNFYAFPQLNKNQRIPTFLFYSSQTEENCFNLFKVLLRAIRSNERSFWKGSISRGQGSL